MTDSTPEILVPRVRGTFDRLPADFARMAALEALALDRFARAGYERLATPILEAVELHERKSGAGIVSKLFELGGQASGRVCLRPELTAGIVRAYAEAEPASPLPWRVSHAGPAFRRESPGRSDRLREFQQVGVERLGDGGPEADAEVIWLADWTLAEAGVEGATIRLGHAGLILEMLGRSGLPASAQAALVDMLSEAAADGGDVGSIGRGLDHFAGWLRQVADSEPMSLPTGGDDGGVDRLFRTLVPVVNGRRPGREIVGRLRRKWDLGRSMLDNLDRVRDRAEALADLKGPIAGVVDRLASHHDALAPESIASLQSLARSMDDHGVDLGRVELDLGFGRGIGFYSQAIFEVIAPTPDGPVEVCGGGRYDGLARVLGGRGDDRGVGFSLGLERLDSVLRSQGSAAIPIQSPEPLRVIPASAESARHAARLATLLRSRGFRAILDPPASSASGPRVVVEGDAMDGRSLTYHDPRGGAPRRVSLADLIRFIADDRGALP